MLWMAITQKVTFHEYGSSRRHTCSRPCRGSGIGALLIRAILFRRRAPIKRLLQRHFGTNRLEGLVITGRKFHARIRADLQRTIDQFFVSGTTVNLTCGIQQQHPFFGVSFSELLAEGSPTHRCRYGI